MTAPPRPDFQVLQEAPIAAPADRAAYREYRIRKAIALLPDDVDPEWREWVIAVEHRLMDKEQSLSLWVAPNR